MATLGAFPGSRGLRHTNTAASMSYLSLSLAEDAELNDSVVTSLQYHTPDSWKVGTGSVVPDCPPAPRRTAQPLLPALADTQPPAALKHSAFLT